MGGPGQSFRACKTLSMVSMNSKVCLVGGSDSRHQLQMLEEGVDIGTGQMISHFRYQNELKLLFVGLFKSLTKNIEKIFKYALLRLGKTKKVSY